MEEFMKFSKKCRYGLKALIDLAANFKNTQVSLGSLAKRNGIPCQYLEQIFGSLRRVGIIKGMKGPQGGYYMNVDPARVTVSEILVALEGPYQIEDEETFNENDENKISMVIQHSIIDKINEQLDDTLNYLTLEDLEKSYFEYTQDGLNMYYI